GALQHAAADRRLRAGLLGVAAAVAITIPSVLIGVYLRRLYSAGLFLGTPFTIGYISAYVFNARQAQSARHTLEVAVLAVALAGGAMLVFALEGALCIALALPLAALLALPGAVLGRAVALRGAGRSLLAGALLAPLVVLVSPRQRAPSHEVVTVIEVDAPPAVVWRHVISFPQLAPPREWPFRVGVAAPMAARIVGSGVGATRYCDFTTGSFVEPVTVWEEGRRLGFAITTQPPPMREWSPYRDVNPPHLDGYFRATHGEFRPTPRTAPRPRHRHRLRVPCRRRRRPRPRSPRCRASWRRNRCCTTARRTSTSSPTSTAARWRKTTTASSAACGRMGRSRTSSSSRAGGAASPSTRRRASPWRATRCGSPTSTSYGRS